MKKIVLGLTALVITFSAMAQKETQQKESANQNERPEWRDGEHGKMKETMEKLNLTADQKVKLRAINEDFKKQMQELKSQNLSEVDMKEKRKSLMMARKEKVSAILTDEQRKQWEAMKPAAGERKEMHVGMGDKKEGRTERLEQMVKELNLNAEQASKFNTLQTSFKAKLKDLKGNTTLTEEQKKAEMKDVFKTYKKSVEEI